MRKKEFTLFEDGARWVRTDFHMHSPYVHSFTLPAGTDLNNLDNLVNLYINALTATDIKIAAITDYQQIRIDFFNKLQTEAEKQGIYLFPGVELSVNYGKGLHILLIFNYNESLSGIDDYIKSLDQNPHDPLIKQDRSHRDIDLQKDLKVVLEEIKSKFQCLVIFPHPNDKNGLLSSFQPKEASELLKFADAIEFIDYNDIKRLVSTGVINNDFFEKLAIIENTDPKSFNEIGSKKRNENIRTTYLKLSSASINAFKLALHDPELRVSIYTKKETKKDRIISLKINGASFFKNIEIKFNSDLNTLIGGRGVGKSAIIEAIRYCLDLPVYTESEFREDFVKNVVGSGGLIEIEVEKIFGDYSKIYKIKRVIGQLPEVEGRDISPKELFEDKIPLILGQKELYTLSLKSDFQLSLIDNLIGDEIKKEEIEFKKLANRLKENARELLNEKIKINKKDEIEQELKTINEHLKTFEELGVADKMAKHTMLIKDEKKLNYAVDILKNQINNQKKSFDEIISEIEKQIQILKKGESEQKNILSETSNIFLEVKEYFEELKKDFKSRIDGYEEKLKKLTTSWEEEKKKYDNEIAKIKQELLEKGLAADRYEDLVKRKSQLEPLLKEYEKLDKKIKELEETRKKLKSQLKDKRHQLFEIRKNKLEEINQKLNDKLKLDIEYLSNKEKFREDLTELLKGSGISKDAINNIIKNDAIDGIELSKLISSGDQKLKETFGLTDTMTKKLIEWFKDGEKLYTLENLFPDDKIIIRLKIENIYKELDKLSVGQKATALLILLFAQEDKILIIDQPEDDLDNRFIYEDVVKILREIKNNRQIILSTHNANIPVLGDADQVIVLDASNNECKIIDNSSIDKNSIVQHIKSIMEGGEEAFKRRIEKYRA